MGNMIRIDGVEYDGPLSWEDEEGDDRIWRVRIRPKPEQPKEDSTFAVRSDTQKVTGSLERDIKQLQENQRAVAKSFEMVVRPLGERVHMVEGGIARLTNDLKLLQENQGNQARGLLAAEDRVDEVERDLDNMRMWVARVAVQTSKNATQVNRCIDKLPSFSIDGEGRAIVRLEVIKG